MAGSHVDGLRHDLSIAVIDEAFRDALNLELLIHYVTGIQKNRIINTSLLNKRENFCSLFV